MPLPSLPLVVYLAGDREIHRPDICLGRAAPLAEQVPAALELDLAVPPDQGPVVAVRGQVQLLRLDRLHQQLLEQGERPPLEFLFVLTDQQDPHHARRDTRHLAPLLRRWCEKRGHVFASALVHDPPNRLDGGGVELIEQLDAHLGATSRVILVSAGGPAALQIAAHFASFRGVRHRDSLRVIQLEEIVGEPDPGVARARPQPVDTRVREVDLFHGVVGRRAIELQAISLLDQLDLPGAAQLVRAAGRAGVLSPQVQATADRLLDRLSRVTAPQTPMDAADAALDLAEVEWSRPAGSAAEALWYAALCAVDLLPAAWAAAHPERRVGRLERETVDRFNRHLGRGAALRSLVLNDGDAQRAAELLSAAPAEVRVEGRTLRFDQLLGADHRGDDPLAAIVWLALRSALRAQRNELAHELIGVSRQRAERTLTEISERFDAQCRALVDDGAVASQQRLREVREVLAGSVDHQALPNDDGRRIPVALRQAAAGCCDEAVVDRLLELVTQPSFAADTFAVLPGGADGVVRNVLIGRVDDQLAQVERSVAAREAILEVLDQGQAGSGRSLCLRIGGAEPASGLRRVLASVLPGLPPENGSLGLARELRGQLDASRAELRPLPRTEQRLG